MAYHDDAHKSRVTEGLGLLKKRPASFFWRGLGAWVVPVGITIRACVAL